VLTVIVTKMTITGGLYVVLIVIVTITGRSICSVNSYCDKNDNDGQVCMQLTVIVIITARSKYTANCYYDNNDNDLEVYRQC
jgi:hypothetical protein